MKDNRRDFIKKSASVAATLSVAGLAGCTGSDKKVSEESSQKIVQWPVNECPDTPKLTLSSRPDATPESMRQLKQIGVDHVLMSGPALPWTEEVLRTIIDRFKEGGLTVINMMFSGFPNVIYGREGRDEEIEKVKASIVAAGAAGLPVMEYNFYAHRLTEGYYRSFGRGGAGYTSFDYNRTGGNPDGLDWMYRRSLPADEMNTAAKDLAPLPENGAHTADQLWANITYFLKAIVPVAEKAGVRLALHPNDPPAPISRGSEQIMGTFNDWKRLVDIVDSPANGMTFDCGVSNEIGEDPLEVLDYLASRDRINHVHYRNCIVETPRLKYDEVFPDNGTVNMFAVMQQLVKRKYKYSLYPEHPRALDYDKAHPAGGEYTGLAYNMAYAKAMMQAVLSL
jgi:mannonate dehydratase